MRILLDTHAFLWFWRADPSLSAAASAAIRDPSNHKYVSVASSWEVAVKVSIGKLDLGTSYRGYIPRYMAANGFDPLPISDEHLALLAELPFHHRDPFDRLLVVQALHERMPLVSADAHLDAYGVHRVW